jgi:hypothetical protein
MILLAAYLLMALIILAADWCVCRWDEMDGKFSQVLWDELFDASEDFLRDPNKQNRHRLERAIEDLS